MEWLGEFSANAVNNILPGALTLLEEARAYPYTAQERQIVESTRSRAIVGGPEEVAARLKELAAQTGADELMINTLMPDPVARRRSYSLVMEAMRG